MKIQLASDLHLEFGEDITIPNVGGDVLVLSGDICMAKKVMECTEFFRRHSDTFKDVIYVMGNHEHYQGDIGTSKGLIQEILSLTPNVHFLERESVEIDGVVFLGATLWTDCNRGDPDTKTALRYGMNDYKIIENCEDGGWKRLTPDDTAAIHASTVDWLNFELSAHRKLEGRLKPTVVCTHHAPSKRSTHPRYKDDVLINGGYSSDLEMIMFTWPQIKLWTHGHTHSSFDYMVEGCRVVANPAGYPMKSLMWVKEDGLGRENPEFDPTKVMEI